ncbi:bifunctional hydroxymethylpyrimidine kinase/phosphomethylpyrimidine kinase [Bernardetia litoralis]|uniref:bifunctional hydroxymethylpyrimidine kinase/phosphomethylpyrimidine kinase n=1 Tax=Bernardetia litoralis TaxID=999 RepID=UPI0003006F64|nr:bifunctional hydroxymethylpyrimidine kinase/phosphomethylpyrimidine kinase [Bernardetia litoralis]
MTIAGSDSGGGAGIQADIKSISACGAYAASVITATTAQNTQGVYDIHAIPIAHLEKQLEVVLDDIHFDAVKIGMLHSCEVIKAVASKLTKHGVKNIVLDPVMVATSGDKLITDNAIDCLKNLLTQARLITPNISEAELLIGHSVNSNNFEDSAKEIGRKYDTSVLLKGGHLEAKEGMMLDVLFNIETERTHKIHNLKIDTNNTHGTGCSLSSSIATFLCLGFGLEIAVEKGCEYVNQAINKGKNMVLGKGNSPINHFGLK